MKSILSRLKLSTKMVIMILSTSAVIYAAAITYISLKAKTIAYNDAVVIVDANAERYSAMIESQLNAEMHVVRTMSDILLKYKDIPNELRNETYEKDFYLPIFKQYPQFLAIWDSWELAYTDSTWTKPYGRYVAEYWREDGSINYRNGKKSLDGDPEAYGKIKADAKEVIIEPYFYSYSDTQADEVLMTSLLSPINYLDRYIGAIGVDISLERFQKLIGEIKPFENSYAFLLSNQGTISGHPTDDFIGKAFGAVYTQINKQHDIVSAIQKSQKITFEAYDKVKQNNAYFSIYPIEIGNTNLPWALGIVVPKNVILAEANLHFLVSLLVGLLGIAILSVIIFIISKNITKPILTTTKSLKELSKGNIDTNIKLNIESHDEIGEMEESVNSLIDGLLHTAEFAKQIGAGDLQTKYNLLSENDVLGNALIQMQQDLTEAKKEEDERKKENEKRNWATQGLAKFAEILRNNTNDIKELSRNIIFELVDYLGASIGGLFIINDENEHEKFLELTACYAYDRQKFEERKILIGEGLVGTCFQEKETIYLTKIPDDYISISSGLGDTNPESILIVPLRLNEEIYGVIELAAMDEFDQHKIEFVEKVAESIASTISSVKINMQTAALLEKSQEQSEEMKAQEEEMRQNMEELQSTQEEMSRKQSQLAQSENRIKAIINGTDNGILTVSSEGLIDVSNNAALHLSEYSKEELYGKNYQLIFKNLTEKNIKKGGKSRQKLVTKAGATIMVELNIHEIHDGENQMHMFFFRDITKEIKKESELIVAMENAEQEKIKSNAALEKLKQQEEELHQNMEEMKTSEEELRQNLEELSATQEEMEKKQQEINQAKDKILAIINGTQDGIFTTDKEGIINMANKAVTKLTGFAENSLIEQSYQKIFKFLKTDKIRFGKKMRQKALTKSGNKFLAEVIINSISDAEEENWLFFFRKIDEEVKKEQELIMSLENAEQEKRKAIENQTFINDHLKNIEKAEELLEAQVSKENISNDEVQKVLTLIKEEITIIKNKNQ